MQQQSPHADSVFSEIRDGVATLTVNRPHTHNALDEQAVFAIGDHLDRILGDARVRVILLRGEGPAFGTGADLNWLQPQDGGAPARVDRTLRVLNPLMHRLRAAPAIVVASVHGVVAGGSLGLMNMADLVIAASNTRFSLAYARIGVTPDVGASYLLPRLLGERRALELMLLAEPFDAARAHHLGLVNFVVPPEQLEEQTQSLVGRLRAGSATALARTKALAYAAADSELATHLEAERRELMSAAAGPDLLEGAAAFRERRAPRFA